MRLHNFDNRYFLIRTKITPQCFQTDVKRHTPGVAFSESRITFRKFKFVGVPGGWSQKIRYACKISLCSLSVFDSCQANNPDCPLAPPDMPETGVNERKRFFANGYRGLSEAHFGQEEELKPFGGLITPEKTTNGGISLKSALAIKRSEKHGFNLHLGTHIFAKVNSTSELLEKKEPMTGDELKLGIARHLFSTGVNMSDLQRMELIEKEDQLEEQSDFVRLKRFYEHSQNRHKRKDETKKQFRKRVRNLIKSERATG